MKYKILFLLALCMPIYLVLAANDDEQQITRAIHSLYPDFEITRIKPSRINGLYEVMLGSEVLYVSPDGRYILKGDMLDLTVRRNLSEDQRSVARKKILNDLPADEFIEFAPTKTEHTIYVFTDITCPYCIRLHQEIPELNKLGIAVRYLAFPRKGKQSAAFRDMESIWCSTDRNKALTDAKFGKGVQARKCNNPVEKQFELGLSLGIRGTPAIYTETGISLPGYMPPEEILKAINESS